MTSSRSPLQIPTKALLCCVACQLTLAVALAGSQVAPSSTTTAPPSGQAATPTIATAPAQNGALIVTLTDSIPGTMIHYTTDGSAPAEASTRYTAPFLVASSFTLRAVATDPPAWLNSSVATRTFAPGIASGTLVWSDEFSHSASASAQPNPATWTYDTGLNCCGNHELETYCAWESTTGPCSPANPNAFIGSDGNLHIVAENPSGTTYTSGRLRSEGLFTFQYGRIEARIKLPESQGMWPAFWLLGSNIITHPWPACGEADIMEHIDGNNPPSSVGAPPPGYDWIAGSVHGGASSSNGANGTRQYIPPASPPPTGTPTA